MSTFHSCEQGRATGGLRTGGEDWQVGTKSQSQEEASYLLWGSKGFVRLVRNAARQGKNHSNETNNRSGRKSALRKGNRVSTWLKNLDLHNFLKRSYEGKLDNSLEKAPRQANIF